MNLGIGQRSTGPWTKRSREFLIFSSNSRQSLTGASVGSFLCPQGRLFGPLVEVLVELLYSDAVE